MTQLATTLATELRLVGYVALSSFMAYTYDWVLSISAEVELVSRRGLSVPIAIYFLSRISQFGYVLFVTVSNFIFLDNCDIIVAILGPATVAIASTQLLWVFRVRAVYFQSRYVTGVFGTLWMCVVACEIYGLISLRGVRISGTMYCMYLSNNNMLLLSVIVFTNDTLALLAVSYRLATGAVAEQGWRPRISSIVTGKGLYSLSRSLMVSEQMYYAASIMFFFAYLAVSSSPDVPLPLHYILVTPYAAFANIMAYNVFRGVALGSVPDSSSLALDTTRMNAAFELAHTD